MDTQAPKRRGRPPISDEKKELATRMLLDGFAPAKVADSVGIGLTKVYEIGRALAQS